MSDTLAPPALPAELSIYTVGEVRAGWLTWMAAHAATPDAATVFAAVDAAQVEVVDAAGVQLLLSIERSLRERGLGLRLAAPSPCLRAACDALGTGALLADGGKP